MNDEKTTEIEIPPPQLSNIVRVNFSERRKALRTDAPPLRKSGSARQPQASYQRLPLQPEWATPWWLRLAALVAILALTLFVL